MPSEASMVKNNINSVFIQEPTQNIIKVGGGMIELKSPFTPPELIEKQKRGRSPIRKEQCEVGVGPT